ncbi:MAG: hypothetical protein WAU01_04600, partial [Saprospiraceae bacterium]
MHIKVFAVILILSLTQIGMAQSAFHRTYPSNTGKEIVCISSMQLKDGAYVALEMMVEVDQNKNKSSDTIIITSYKPKGDINWSKRIALPDSLKGYIPYLKESVFRGSIIQGNNDSIYYSIATSAPGTPNKIIGVMDSGGVHGWMRSYTTEPGKADGNTTSHLLVNYNKTFFSGHIGGNAVENDVAISRKNYQGNNIWSKL